MLKRRVMGLAMKRLLVVRGVRLIGGGVLQGMAQTPHNALDRLGALGNGAVGSNPADLLKNLLGP